LRAPLSTADNKIGDAGAEAIGKALSESKLEQLYLGTFRFWCQSRAPRSFMMLILFARVLLSTGGNKLSQSAKDNVKQAWAAAGKSGDLYGC
jgi:hypothetical protein